jgi:hypothetical protein
MEVRRLGIDGGRAGCSLASVGEGALWV